MKIKEILRNKWGWAGAIIGLVPLLILLNIIPFALPNYPILFFIFSPEALMLMCDSCAGDIGVIFSNTAPMFWIVFIIGIIKWFIVGLILQKLWRKFK